VNIIQGIIQKNQPLDPKIFCKVKQGNYSKKPTSRSKNILQSQTRELFKKTNLSIQKYFTKSNKGIIQKNQPLDSKIFCKVKQGSKPHPDPY
jgi:hypothetical protein